MKSVSIVRRICIEAQYLDSNIMSHIFSKIVDSTKNECTKANGHIIRVKKIERILENKIANSNSDIVFTVQFKADTLLPKDGMEVVGTVCMVYKDGIFIDIEGKQKMLIPSSSLISSSYDDILNSFEHEGGVIKLGDTVKAKITATRYDKHSFSCFGSIA